MRCVAPASAIQRQADRLVWRLYLIKRRIVVKWRHAGESGLVCGFELRIQAADLNHDGSILFHTSSYLKKDKDRGEQDVNDA